MLLAEQLVGEARARRLKRMTSRERIVVGASASAFLGATAALILVVPNERPVQPLLIVGLVAAYALVSRVRFEFGSTFVVPEQLVFVPMVLLTPLAYVPLLVAAAATLAMVPDYIGGTWRKDSWIGCLSDSWFALGPVVVLAVLAPGAPRLDLVGLYLLAFAGQLVVDLCWSLIRDRLVDGVPLKTIVTSWAGVARVDAILSPIAFLASVIATDDPLALLAIAPLVLLLDLFSRERQQRYGATLELNRAYRGTVMLLADVVEFDDSYTAAHCRSVVDLVETVADEMEVHPDSRQELEFAALLHDVGKIAIPKAILHKPARLTGDEFDLMKTHTIEGQFMLDRVGGLLGRVGEIVRSCHERWDGRGYPDGLAGDQIPLEARIVFACDAYNAMTTDRPYRAALQPEEVISELVVNAGTQFDPDVVACLTKVVEDGEPVSSASHGVRAVLANAPVSGRVGAAT